MSITLKHPNFKKIKEINKNEVVLIIENKEITISRKEINEILKEFKFAENLLSSYLTYKVICKNTDNYLYYHDKIRDNVSKFLIGKDKINLEKDYDELENKIPFMKLKTIYEQFYRLNFVDKSGNVLIKSIDDLKEPIIFDSQK